MKEKTRLLYILNFQLFPYYPTMFSFHRIHLKKKFISITVRGKTADLKDYQTKLLVIMSSLSDADKL